MRQIVLYASRYGATEQYARELARALGCEAVSCLDAPPLSGYDRVIFGGAIYAGRVLGLSRTLRLAKKPERLQWYFFTVGLYDPADVKNRAAIRAGLRRTLPPALYDEAHIFHLRGRLRYEKLSYLHRTLIRLLARSMAGKKEPSQEEAGILLLQEQGADFVDPAALAPLLAALQETAS